MQEEGGFFKVERGREDQRWKLQGLHGQRKDLMLCELVHHDYLARCFNTDVGLIKLHIVRDGIWVNPEDTRAREDFWPVPKPLKVLKLEHYQLIENDRVNSLLICFRHLHLREIILTIAANVPLYVDPVPPLVLVLGRIPAVVCNLRISVEAIQDDLAVIHKEGRVSKLLF